MQNIFCDYAQFKIQVAAQNAEEEVCWCINDDNFTATIGSISTLFIHQDRVKPPMFDTDFPLAKQVMTISWT